MLALTAHQRLSIQSCKAKTSWQLHRAMSYMGIHQDNTLISELRYRLERFNRVLSQ